MFPAINILVYVHPIHVDNSPHGLLCIGVQSKPTRYPNADLTGLVMIDKHTLKSYCQGKSDSDILPRIPSGLLPYPYIMAAFELVW